MTLSKLKQEGREEFEARFHWKDGVFHLDRKQKIYHAPELKAFLTVQIEKAYKAGQQSNITTITLDGELPKERLPKGVEQEVYWKVRYEELKRAYKKAYLSALSDVEKGLPKEVDLKDRFWGKSEVEYGFEHTHNNVLSAVREVISKLKESK